MRVCQNVSNSAKTICNDKIRNVKMIYRAAWDVLDEDVSIKYCMQSTLAMGRAAKTSALEQMEQMKKSFQLQFHPRNFKHCHSISSVIQIRIFNHLTLK